MSVTEPLPVETMLVFRVGVHLVHQQSWEVAHLLAELGPEGRPPAAELEPEGRPPA